MREPLRRTRVDPLGLALFDHRRYARSAAAAGAGRLALYRHFLAVGWRQGLDPTGWFSCRDYLRANPDVAAAGANPWVHFIEVGRFEDRRLSGEPSWPASGGVPRHGASLLRMSGDAVLGGGISWR